MKRARSSRYQLRQRSSSTPVPESPESVSTESVSDEPNEDNDETFDPIENSSDDDDDDDIADDVVNEAELKEEYVEEPEHSDEPPKRKRKATGRRALPTNLGKGEDQVLANEIDWQTDGSEETSDTKISREAVASIQPALLRWYHRNARELPWRVRPRDPDAAPAGTAPPTVESAPGAPYAVWISEVMSQQTRIEVVARYWKRWMEALPTVRALAYATPERVRELWAGLGYYRRAQNLHIAAQEIVAKHNGLIPRTSKVLATLRGVGPYTAGAVASIAFGERSPAVDGNVARVLARLRPAIADLTGKELIRAQEAAAKQLLSAPAHPADLNQALMELGATVCLPRAAAKCHECVLSDQCGAAARARKMGVDPAVVAADLPKPTARKKVKVRSETVAACVVCTKVNGEWQFLVTQRKDDCGLLAGLWETPSRVVKKENVTNDKIFQGILTENVDVEDVKLKKAKSVTHIFSHIKQELAVRVAVLDDVQEAKNKACKWVTSEELVQIALSTQMLKVFKAAGDVIGQKIARKI